MSKPTEQRSLRVLVVDDNRLVCDALRLMINIMEDAEFLGSLPSADELYDTVLDRQPDVVILDLDMPGADPIEVVRALSDVQPSTRIIIYTGHVRQALIDRVFDAGAWGFVGKCEPTETVIDAIRRVAEGEVIVAPGSQ